MFSGQITNQLVKTNSKFKLKKFMCTIAEFSTILGKRGSNLNKSSFEYSLKLITKYLFYCVVTIIKTNKNLKKID